MVALGCAVNETDCSITGLTEFGTDLGGFLTNLAPGVVAFVFVLAVVGGLIGIFAGIAFVIKKSITKKS